MFGSSQWMYSSGGFYGTEIDGSLRFNDDDSAYLTRTPASAGNRKTFTFSTWFKIGNISSLKQIIGQGTGVAGGGFCLYFNSNQTLRVYSGSNDILTTNALFRDPSAWYHIVLEVDTTQATASNRVRLYVNGVEQTYSATNYPSQNTDLSFNQASEHRISGNTSASYLVDGYLAEVNFIDGTALDPTSFGETKSGVWIPKAYSGSYGTNGFHLEFAGNANDSSGNGNNWTANNITSDDYVSDSPTDNFATWNALFRGGEKSSSIFATSTLSDGNLKVSVPTNSYMGATMRPTSGQYYCEATIDTVTVEIGWGWLQATEYSGTTAHAGVANKWGAYYHGYAPADLYLYDETTLLAQPTITLSNGNIIQWAWDIDNGKGWIGVNNSWYDSSGGTTGNPATGANPTFTFTADEAENLQVYVANGTGTAVFTANFGQQDFTYTPPTGYLALCTENLTVAEAVDPAEDNSPQDYFNTVLYTGDGTSNRDITGFGFDPDFNWLKMRSSADNHVLTDVLRGTNHLHSNTTDADSDISYPALTTDGFTVSGGTYNNSGATFVAWAWKANGSAVSNTDGSITSQVSANTTSGFSIVSYTGSSNESVGHGLDQAPEMIMVKDRDATSNWAVYHQGVQDQTANGFLELNTTSAVQTGSNPRFLSGTAGTSQPTSTVFYVNNYSGSSTNNTGNDYIAHCFHSVEGFSKFGSYTGNGSSDGTFVYTGFRPAFLMWKRTDSADNWSIEDSARSVFNPNELELFPNRANAEENNGAKIDFLSNGFKFRNTNGNMNASGGSYIYMAFAENPFKYANAR